MSDLLIRGMELPENCWSCRMFCNCFACEGYDCHCAALGKDIGTEAEVPRNKRRDDCPLVPIPGHGRLGDLDALAAQCDDPYWCVWLSEIEAAPTIIPAEEEEA